MLDVLTLLGLLLALSVWLSGGFRVPTPFGRLSVTSPWRPLVVAIVMAALRHAGWRRPLFPQVVGTAVATWWRAPATRAAFPVFLATRAGVLLVGLLAVFAFGYANPDGPPYRIFENEFLNLPARWDAGWYMGIAMAGYEFQPGRFDIQQNIAFFPGYPMLVRYGRLLMGGQTLWAGVVISLIAFLWALTYLHRLARQWMDDERAAATLALLASYPFAVFYGNHYSEALFLLATVAAWYHFAGDRLLPAAAWGLLAGLTRPNGCFLSVPFGLMVLWPVVANRFRPPATGGWPRVADRLAVAAMPGIGMLLYSAFMLDLTGDPLAWAKLHGAWGRTYQSLDALLSNELHSYVSSGVYGVVSSRLTDFMNGLGVLFAIGCAWGVFRRFGVPMAVYILVTVLPPLANGGLLSMGRVTSVLFPCFMWLGAVLPAGQRTAWVAAFALLQALVAAMFYTWRPMY